MDSFFQLGNSVEFHIFFSSGRRKKCSYAKQSDSDATGDESPLTRIGGGTEILSFEESLGDFFGVVEVIIFALHSTILGL
jgi:hypothetical protein